jgi:hypothetical protein
MDRCLVVALVRSAISYYIMNDEWSISLAKRLPENGSRFDDPRDGYLASFSDDLITCFQAAETRADDQVVCMALAQFKGRMVICIQKKIFHYAGAGNCHLPFVFHSL